MTVCDYLVDFLIERGATDVFGIPGGVILDFLYAIDRRSELRAHLCYHEQAAVFSASGYAQATGKPGIAYATRGPGILNMMTGIADAYYDSIPLLIFTAHEANAGHSAMRSQIDQETDVVSLAQGITKFAARIDDASSLRDTLEHAYLLATKGRKGPVLLDISKRIWRAELETDTAVRQLEVPAGLNDALSQAAEFTAECLRSSNRPVLLIGDGVHQAGAESEIEKLAQKQGIPVLSSRSAQDVIPLSPFYFGYIGSHGLRYSNFILAKSDLLISIGNRLSYPSQSKSFAPMMAKKRVIRLEIDSAEFERDIPAARNICGDLREFLPMLNACELDHCGREPWLEVCGTLRSTLWEWDLNATVIQIADILRSISSDSIIVSDVGNNEMWLSRAYAFARADSRVLFSKSFGSLGCALPKGIGACIATGKKTFCFVGDQGLQLNIQELQLLSKEQLPLTVILLNNRSSGMIRSRELQMKYPYVLHTTEDSGYSTPDFAELARAYRISYTKVQSCAENIISLLRELSGPRIVELLIDPELDCEPNLPIGKDCQDMAPVMERALYTKLNAL